MTEYINRADAINAVASVDDYSDGIGYEVRNHCIRDLHLLPAVDCIPLNTKLPGRCYYITVHKNEEGYVEWFEIEKVDKPNVYDPALWERKEQTMKVKITVEIGESQKKLLDAMVEHYGGTVDDFIREAIYEYYSDERRRMERSGR